MQREVGSWSGAGRDCGDEGGMLVCVGCGGVGSGAGMAGGIWNGVDGLVGRARGGEWVGTE
jgi:hypothetical protein